MRELGMVLFGCMILYGFVYTMVWPNLEYTGYSRNSSCYGECYEEYVRTHGTLSEQMAAKQEEAASDPFSSIRGLWAGCAACHGNEGAGMGAFPALAGRDAEYIIQRLTTCKNRGQVGSMSATMWGQAAQLSDKEIELLGEFVQETLK